MVEKILLISLCLLQKITLQTLKKINRMGKLAKLKTALSRSIAKNIMKEGFSEELKKSIDDGFIAVDRENKTAEFTYSSTPTIPNEILLYIRKVGGLKAELEQRHNYSVIVSK